MVMRAFKWWLRRLGQRLFPKLTLAILAHRTWVLEPEIALIGELSRSKAVAIDAGANKGVYLYHLSRIFDRVVAFEPLPMLADYLRRSVPSNAEVHGLALSNAEGQATLRLPSGFDELGSLEAHTKATWTTSAEIETHDVTLRTLDSYRIDNVSLIKIDVEGHELAVLEGARETIARWRPTILVEVEERHGAGSVARVRDYLEQLGYVGHYLDGRVVKPIDNFDIAADQSIASLSDSVKVDRYINNFIFLDNSQAVERLAAMQSAIAGANDTAFDPAIGKGRAAPLHRRMIGPMRATRETLFAQPPRS